MDNLTRYFQVYQKSTDRWIKYDRQESRITASKKTPGKYKGIPVWGRTE
jgi:hypothetical protein